MTEQIDAALQSRGYAPLSPQERLMFKANQGTPDALPYGGATAANEAMAAVPETSTGGEPAAGTEGAERQIVNEADIGLRTGPPREPSFRPQDEELAWAFAGVPEEPNYGRMQTLGGRIPPPREVYAALPLLKQAAMDPSAPQQVKDLYRVVAYHLGR